MTAVVVVGAVVVGGSYLLLHSSAQSTFLVQEAENGTNHGPVCQNAAPHASGAAAVRFNCGGSASGVQARRAADFIDSLGVNIHPTADSYADLNLIQTNLAYIGFHNLRVNLGKDAVLSYRQSLISQGMHLDYTTLPPAHAETYPTTAEVQTAIDKRVADIKNNHLEASTLSIESFNEYNGDANLGNPDWAGILQTAQPYLFNQMRANLGTGPKVLGPSLIAKDLKTDAKELGDVSGSIDYENIHTYYGGLAPESNYDDATPQTADFQNPAGCAALTDSETFDERIEIATTCNSKAKPIIITETGYHNDKTVTNHTYTSMPAAAIYFPRVLLETFRIGIAKTFIYELMDEPYVLVSYSRHLGLFTSDGQAKPAADAIHNLTSLLNDTAADSSSFAPGKLNFSLAGTTTNLHKVLLQKADGSYWLALWQGVSVFDRATEEDITDSSVQPQAVTLKLGTASTATVYADNGTTAQNLGQATQFNLQIGPKVSLIKIVQ